MKLSSRIQTRILVALNTGAALALAGWAINSFQPDQDTVSGIGEADSDSPPIAQRAVLRDSVEAHPLFDSTRLPVADAALDQPPAATIQPPPLLVGVVKGADGRVGGLMEDPQSGSRKFVRDGEDFLGWKLVSLRSKTAVMRSGSQEAEIQLSFNSRSLQNPGNPGQNPKNP